MVHKSVTILSLSPMAQAAAASAALLSALAYSDLRSFTLGLVGAVLLIALLCSLTTLATGEAMILLFSSPYVMLCFSGLSPSVATELCMSTGCELRLDC